MSAVVIGIGNEHRRDDGVGPAVADRVGARGPAGVRVVSCPAEPTAILDAWAGAELAVVIDAVVGGSPGRVHRRTLADLAEPRSVSSHDLNLAQTYRLGLALGRAPASVVVVGIGVADTGHGVGLSPAVAAVLPEAVQTVLDILAQQTEESPHQQP
ncbi:MAG TPA: hydrogenase maturation protease [Mycobacterium sp.]|nr:hydrogenase maturation protease [Mycobacterium sp.]